MQPLFGAKIKIDTSNPAAARAELKELKTAKDKLNKKLKDLPKDRVEIMLKPSQSDPKDSTVQRPVAASIRIKGESANPILIGLTERQSSEQGPEALKPFMQRVHDSARDLMRIAKIREII